MVQGADGKAARCGEQSSLNEEVRGQLLGLMSKQRCREAGPGKAARFSFPFWYPAPSAVAPRVISPGVPVVKGLSGAEVLVAVVSPRVGVKSAASGSSVPFDPLIQVSLVLLHSSC